MTQTEMTPLDSSKTVRSPNFNRTGTQTWAAVSKDSRWTYTRLEQTGTPWAITDGTGADLYDWYGTLKAARQHTAAIDAGQTPAVYGYDTDRPYGIRLDGTLIARFDGNDEGQRVASNLLYAAVRGHVAGLTPDEARRAVASPVDPGEVPTRQLAKLPPLTKPTVWVA